MQHFQGLIFSERIIETGLKENWQWCYVHYLCHTILSNTVTLDTSERILFFIEIPYTLTTSYIT